MSLSLIPAGMTVGGSISASDVRVIYESVTGGQFMLNIGDINCDIFVSTTLRDYTYGFSAINSWQTSFNSYARNTDIDTIAFNEGLTASASYYKKMMGIQWYNTTISRNVFSTICCIKKSASQYKWIKLWERIQ